MPIEEIKFGRSNNETPQLRLAMFVRQVGSLLQSAIFEEGPKLFYMDMLPHMQIAWQPVSERIAVYSNRVADEPIASLKEHGLTDEELEFKFSAINFIARRFYQSVNGPLSALRAWFSRLLEVLDTLLRSLVAAVPGGHAIEEYKDICESLVPSES